MYYKLTRLLLTFLLLLGIRAQAAAFDTTPRPVVICSGANIIIKGDPTGILPSSYQWEIYQSGSWIPAPGGNNSMDYLASSLFNVTEANIVFNLRRKTTILGILDLDSYYLVTVRPVLPTTNNTIALPLVNSFCGSGTPDIITGSIPVSADPVLMYQWQWSTDNLVFYSIDGAYAKDYTPEKITVTTYFRRIAIIGGCGLTSTSNSIKLTVVPVLANNSITAPVVTVICANGDPGLIAGAAPSGGTGTYVYKWQKSTDNVNFSDISGATSQNYDPPAVNVTTYFRRIIVSEPCNIALSSNVVSIQLMPELLVPEFVQSNVGICAGRTAVLTIKNPISGISYYWYDSAARTNLLHKGLTYTTTALLQNKTYYVASDNGTCSSTQTGTVQVTVSALPNANVVSNGGKTVTCAGSSGIFTIQAPNPDFIYKWYTSLTGGTEIGSGSTWTSPSVSVKTIYYLEVLNKEGCPSASRQPVEVDVLPVLTAPVVSVDNTTQHSITFRWTAVSGATGYKVSIDNGQTYTDPSSGSNGLSHTVTGLRGSETVAIVVKATGSLTCQESENSTSVSAETVKEFDDIYVANAFTPNNDGKNDIVYVRSQTVKTLRFYIYNQWGEQIFYSTDVAFGWDGNFKGKNQPVGVYVYVVKAVMNNGREVNKKGTITLIK